MHVKEPPSVEDVSKSQTAATSATKHPIIIASGIFSVFLAGSLLGGMLGALLTDSLIFTLVLSEAILSLVAVALVKRFGWWERAGFANFRKPAEIKLFIPLVFLPLLSFIEGVNVSNLSDVISFALLSVLVGFAEEAFFRGLMITALAPAGARCAVILSALLFGIPHAMPAITGAWDPLFTAVNAFAALGIGLSFGALFVRTKGIWSLVSIHAAIDFTALVSEGSLLIGEKPIHIHLVSGATAMLLIAYGLWLLRGTDSEVREGAASG